MRAVLSRFYRFASPICLAASRIRAGAGVRLWGFPLFAKYAGSTIEIGNRVVICSDSRFTALGVDRRSVLRTLRPGARIVIGDDVGMSGVVICAAKEVSIGSSCLFGANVTVVDTDFHPVAPSGRAHCTDWDRIAIAPVCIESNVFVGAYSLILKGVTIGENSVIGAGSVVVGNIPSNCIAAGNPCRVIRPMSQESGF